MKRALVASAFKPQPTTVIFFGAIKIEITRTISYTVKTDNHVFLIYWGMNYMLKFKNAFYLGVGLICALVFNQCSGFNAAQFGSASLGSNVFSSIQCTPGSSAKFPRRAWRLTGQQYINTVKTLFPSVQNVNNPFKNEASPGAFANNSNGLNLGKLLTENLINENEKIGPAAVSSLQQTYSCLGGNVDSACATQVVKGLTPRLFRRILTATETSSYAQFLVKSVADYGTQNGISAFVQALLLSPNFLFRYEVGDRATGMLDPYEKAALISYSASDNVPDDELMAAAEAGALQTRDQVRNHFVRLARKSGRYELFVDFFRQYLHYDAAASKVKDSGLFPQFNATVAQALVNETDALIVELLKSGAGSIKEFLSTDMIMTQSSTASFYNQNPGSFSSGALTKTRDSNRAGLLTQPSFLVSVGSQTRTSPVKMGALIRMSLLCTPVPEAPPGIAPLEDVSVTEYPTQRARLAVHNRPVCASCHKYMDSIGLGFENFDAVGAIRTTENGQPVDDSGEISYTNSSLDGPFKGGAALGRKLASSDLVKSCFMQRSYLYVTGQVNEVGSQCFVENVKRTSTSSIDNLDVVQIFAEIFSEFIISPRFGVLEN